MTDKVAKSDWKFVPVDPDSDFDAKHNKKIIANVIAQNEKMRARKLREWEKGRGERISAIASYVKHADKTKSDMSPTDYFGKKYIAYLRGEQIVDRLKRAKKEEQSKEAKV